MGFILALIHAFNYFVHVLLNYTLTILFLVDTLLLSD